jgi:CBS domain-containing protein
MKIKDVMSNQVETCSPETTLADAAWKMWERDCGALPVVAGDKLIGMISDRDIAIAIATRASTARQILVKDVLNRDVIACDLEESVDAALQVMAVERVRRIPVVDSRERLRGMLSINDLILTAHDVEGPSSGSPSYRDVMASLKEICEHREKVVKKATPSELRKR